MSQLTNNSENRTPDEAKVQATLQERKERSKVQPAQDTQEKTIRKILMDHYNKNFANVHRLVDILAEKQYGGIKFPYCRVKKTLFEGTMDLHVVLALCRLWNISYDDIFKISTAETEDQDYKSSIATSGMLLDEKYMGTYYLYMFSNNEKSGKITKAQFSMNTNDGFTTATLEYYDDSGKHIKPNPTYIGTPKIIGDDNTIFVELKYQNSFLHLYTNYQEYNNQHMYFRKGFVVGTESTSHKPLFKHFILTSSDIFEKLGEDKLRSLLMVNNNYFVIPKKDITDKNFSEKTVQWIEKHGSSLRHEEECYIIDEMVFIHDASQNGRYRAGSKQLIEAMDVILELKTASYTPSHIIASDINELSTYVKKML